MTNGLPQRLVLATHNPGKAAELQTLLGPLGIEAVPIASFDPAPPDETGLTYQENASLKARAALELTGLPALADDAGLAVDRLDGRPGIATARYATRAGGWPQAREQLAAELGLREGETARASLCCALCVAMPDTEELTVFARVTGELRWPPKPNLPGFVSMFDIHHGDLVTDGVLAHRRAAFDLLLERLRSRS